LISFQLRNLRACLRAYICVCMCYVSRVFGGPKHVVKAVCVGYLVDKVALGQVALRTLLFSPVSLIPPALHIHILLSGVDAV
jgi:hypothetical protein